ncbi:FRG domain-containing protein [Nitrosococcus wardiae]|uniref:FRG domain-containing protein n=1 Tax=Nitrosococcus wardiae TaxID=1814290 RepID=A0A4P7C147_9GAMM|nr:FRG domain-containing protein [Nitrosococcus wardiae]
MQEIQIKSLVELQRAVTRFDGTHLFRGQTRHYLNAYGQLNIPSSFDRHGCMPPLMFKWTHYSKALIRAFTGLDYHSLSMGMSQAVLQHYGWRSFFIDLTKSPHVACWFAANAYQENRSVQLCEDFEENPAQLIHRAASFSVSSEPGHLYVVDPNYLIPFLIIRAPKSPTSACPIVGAYRGEP